MSGALVGGTVWDGSGLIRDGVVSWSGGTIDYVGPAASFEGRPDTSWDVSGCLVMPGLVNLHTHTPMTALRGLAEDLERGRWLPRVVALEAELTPEQHYWSALAGAWEMIRNGVTFVADRGSDMARCGTALWDSGIRAVAAQTLLDDGFEARWRESEELLETWGTSPRSRVFAGLGPHATDSCGDACWERVRDRAEETGALVFAHLAQSQEEVAAVRKRGERGCVHYLERMGVLGPRLVAAHATFLEEDETPLLIDSGACVAHCPTSNAKIEGVAFPAWRLSQAGLRLGLGTDCVASHNVMDPFFEAKAAALLQKVLEHDPSVVPAGTAARWLTAGPASCLGVGDRAGRLAAGAFADIVAIRLDANGGPGRLPAGAAEPALTHLVYAASRNDVDTVVVDGRLRVRGGAPQGLDEERVAYELASIRSKLGA